MMGKNNIEKTYHVDLDVARGMMILLMVFRHAVNTTLPEDLPLYVYLYLISDWFNMPFFMFISGIVSAFSIKRLDVLSDFFSLLKSRAIRLLIPYFLFAGIVFAGKMLLQNVVTLEKPVSGFNALFMIILAPKQSSFGSYLWFVYVLFLFYFVVSLAKFLLKKNWMPVCLALGFILQFVEGTDYLAIKQFNAYFFYFVFGNYVYKHYSSYLDFIQKYRYVFILMLGLFIGVTSLVEMTPFIVGMLSLPVLHYFSRIDWVENNCFLLLCGRYMYPIYLMNTFFINFFKMLYACVFPLDGGSFLFFALLCIPVGVLGPYITQRMVIRRIPYLNTIIR